MTRPIKPSEPIRGRGWRTRRRIIEAAFALFSERGYRQTTIAAVAETAGVAVPTVYLGFRNKPALFVEAYRFGVEGGRNRPPYEEPWYKEMAAEPDIRRAVTMWVNGAAEILRQVTPLESALRGLSGEPELIEFKRYSAALQRQGYRLALDDLTTKAPLRASLTPEDATSILLVIVGVEAYRSFTVEHGWSDARWREWTSDAMLELLFRT